MHLSDAGGRTIAADLVTAFGSVDAAILDAARLTTSIMETHNGARGLAPALAQRAIDAVTDSLAKMAEGRRSMVATHRALVIVKDGSNLAETNYGCWTVEEAGMASRPLVTA